MKKYFCIALLSVLPCANAQIDPASQYGTDQFNQSFRAHTEAESRFQTFLEKQQPPLSRARVEFPPGLNAEESSLLWHLSEGSDVFPLRWFLHIQSQASPMPNTPLAQDLDQKFGVLVDRGTHHRYPIKYVGLTAAWSDAPPTESDALLAREDEPLQSSEVYNARTLSNGQKSIAMVGTNCAFCHSGQISVGGKSRLFEGAPNMLYIRGFFQDLAGSTVKTLLDEKLLTTLLQDTGSPDVRDYASNIAKDLSSTFRLKLLGRGLYTLGELQSFLSDGHASGGDRPRFITTRLLGETKIRMLKQDLFEKRELVQEYLVKLLALTYSIPEAEISSTLKLRMKWLSFLLGANPEIQTTNEGFARTDAFGRISNWVARGDNPIALTATVSVPPMWAIKYKTAFHYNSNTNSVIMRNIGQAFGLGAILTGDGTCDTNNCSATANLHNLNQLESLLYKIKIPNWQEAFPESPVAIDKAIAGCTTFQRNCAGCHDSAGERLGPAQRLIGAQIFSPQVIGTDENYAKLQGTPVLKAGHPLPFREALFTFTKNVRDHYFRQYQIPMSEVAVWQRAEIRGGEVFRDTYLGEKLFPENTEVVYFDNVGHAGEAYSARNLAGVWATAPYLHNGSVQNLESLLSTNRPRFFFLGTHTYDARRLGFDSDPVANEPITEGQRYTYALGTFNPLTTPRAVKDNLVRCILHPANCMDTADVGNRNRGHEFGTKLSAGEKSELIEFLKILRPEPEYSWTTPPTYKVRGLEGPTALRTCAKVEADDVL